MVTLDAATEADLKRVMARRGFATEEETLRAVVREAAQSDEAPEEVQRQRAAALKEMWGMYADKGPDLPRLPDGNVDWKSFKAEIHEGMP